MSEDDLLDRVRQDASKLRWEPDDVVASRVAARVRASIAERATVGGVLTAWFRPVIAGLVAALVIGFAAFTWLAAEPADALLAGSDTSMASEVYYSDAR